MLGSCAGDDARLINETPNAPNATPPRAAAMAMAIGRLCQRSAKLSSGTTNRSAAGMVASP
jgi:hypothetical protein